MNHIRTKLLFRGFKGYFSRILLSFLLIILVPTIFLGAVLYIAIYQQSKSNLVNQQKALMNEISTNIQSQIDEIQQELAIKRVDHIYANYNSSNQDVMELYTLSRDLNLMTQKSSLLHSVYFIDLQTNKIFNTFSGMYRLDDFYDTHWYENIQNTMELQRLPVRINMNKDFYDNIRDKKTIIYNPVQVLTIVAANYPRNIIAANIDVIRLYQNIAQTYSLNETGDFYFINTSNEILYGPNGTYGDEIFEINISETYESDTKSLISNGKVYFFTPIYYEEVFCVVSYPINKFNQLPEYFVFFTFLICTGLAIGLSILAYIVSKKLYKPINTLCKEIKENSHIIKSDTMVNEDEMETLSYVFKEMNTYYKITKQELETYKKIAKSSEFRMYLTGIIDYEKFRKENEEFIERNKDSFYFLFLIKIELGEKQDEFNKLRVLLQKVMDVYLKTVTDGVFIEIEHSKFAIILTGKSKEFINNAKIIILNAMKGLNIDIFHISISDPFRNVDDMVEFYQSCNEHIDYAIYFDIRNKIVDKNVMKMSSDSDYDAIINYETHLIKEVISHNKKGCQNILHELKKSLLSKGNIIYCENVYRRILVTIDKEFVLGKKFNMDIIQTGGKRTLDDRIQSLEKICFFAIEKFDSNDVVENQYCLEAKEFLDVNFDQDFEIVKVAESMNLSYSYLSKIFKAHMNMRLSEYLNYIRIEKGKEYLIHTNLTLKEIAEKIGYNNCQSFQRFFKKYENITPGDYRKHYKI